jgi:predicted ATPase
MSASERQAKAKMSKSAKARPPAHFSKLALRNFRGFLSTKPMALRPLTFIVGPNSSGKSSIFDAFLFLAQSGLLSRHDSQPTPTLSWIGSLVDLGSYEDTISGHDSNSDLVISATVDLDPQAAFQRRSAPAAGKPVRFEYRFCSAANDPAGRLRLLVIVDEATNTQVKVRFGKRTSAITSISIADKAVKVEGRLANVPWFHVVLASLSGSVSRRSNTKFSPEETRALKRMAKTLDWYNLEYFISAIQRVSSARTAPKRWYPTTTGDNVVAQSQLIDEVNPAHIKRIMHGGGRPLAYWHFNVEPAKIADINAELARLDIATDITAKTLSAYHSTLEVTDNRTQVRSKLVEVGYGTSQVLPVIIACHSRAPGPLFIEQPEIHLHPKAQGTIAELLCRTSLQRQVIVETHSEHMINKARLFVAEGKLSPERMCILYVDRSKAGSKVTEIRVDERGEFVDEWPDGFFDERFQDTMQLAALSD